MNQGLKFQVTAVTCNAIAAAVMMLILFIFRDASVPVSKLLLQAGLPALAYVIIASIVLCSLSSCFGAENFRASGEAYTNAFKKLGAVPIKAIGLSVLIQLVFLGAIFILGGNALPEERTSLFLTIFSVIMLISTFIYVMADGMVSRALASYNLTAYPRDLRENRLGLKILIVPVAVTIISILFSISFLLLALVQSGVSLSDIGGNTWAFVVLSLAILFSWVVCLASILKKNLGFFFNSVIVQLENLSSAKKDLTRRISICSVDELGTIAGMVNSFCGNMGSGMRDIKGGQHELSASSVELERNAASIVSSILQILDALEQVRVKTQNQMLSVSESSAVVQEIAKNIESLDGSISKQASSVSRASSAVEEMVGNIESIGGVVERMQEQFKTVNTAASQGAVIQKESSGKVQEIVEESKVLQEANKIIASIAAQTNLLAMNAAIEAAHAGDAGRGFSVVADEIRKLAETSSRESQKISAQLKQITETIDSIVKGSEASERAFSQVSGRIGETEKLVFEVGNAIREQQEGAGQVLDALKTMNDITTEVETGSKEMNKGNAAMLQEMNKLQSASREISDSMEEMVKSVTGVNEGAEQVSALAANSQSTIKNITVIVDSFEV
jgi:methyl-accepting chemotaxis protein